MNKKINNIFFLLLLSIFNLIKSDSRQTADIIIFSCDRPMQLYAFLESIEKYIKDINDIWIIYRVSNDQFDKAYENCFNYFPKLNIKKIKQINETANQTFKSLLTYCLKSSKSEYLLFGVDDIIVKDNVQISDCINYLKKTNAYGFYLRLGKNISQCYTEGIQTPIPQHEEIENGVYLVEFKDGKGDWGYPCNLDMTLYNREKIIESISSINFTSPNRLEGNWHVNEWFFNPIKDKKGLFFQDSKIVNIPLNVVQSEFISKNMGISSKELLEKFEKGLKINIDSFHKIFNRSPHIEFDITFSQIFPFSDLYDAIKNQNLNKIDELKQKFNWLIKQKADGNIYNLKDENGYTPLMWAANCQNLECANFLINNGADVNATDKNECSALIFACWRGNAEIVELLVKNKANIDIVDVNGTTALEMADRLNSPVKDKIISILIGQEA